MWLRRNCEYTKIYMVLVRAICVLSALLGTCGGFFGGSVCVKWHVMERYVVSAWWIRIDGRLISIIKDGMSTGRSCT